MKVHNLLVTGSLTSGGENISTISSSVSTTVTELSSSLNSRLDGIQTSTGSLNTFTSSANNRLNSVETSTGSLNTFTSSANNRLNSIESVTGSYATTGSNTFNGNLTVTGFIDAQELRTTYISSSILYRSGSTKFGDELTDTHAFTGSMLLSGSLTVNGTSTIQNTLTLNGSNNVIRSGNELRFNRADNAVYTRLYDAGSLAANGFILDNINGEGFHFQNNGTTIMRMNSSGNVGINRNNPTRTLDILGATGIGTLLKLEGASGTTTYLQLAYNGATNAQSGYIGYNSSSQLLFFTNDTLALTIDSNRNLGLGVTPSTWTLGRAIEVGNVGNGIWNYGVSNTNIVANSIWNNGNKYASNGFATQYAQNNGNHEWLIAPSGTSGNAISFTQPMSLTSNGNLLIGTTTDNGARLQVSGTSTFSGNATFSSSVTAGGSGNVILGVDASYPTYNTIGFGGTLANGQNRIFAGNSSTNDGVYLQSKQGINFWVNGTSEVATVTSNSYFRMLAGSGGIQFNGDTAAANALDDYEEGTWTPDIVFGSWSFGVRSGFYTKIGNLVTANLLIVWSANNSPSGDSFRITLPFTAFGSGNFRAPASIGYTAGVNFNTSRQLVAHVDMGQNYVSFQQLVSGGNPTGLTTGEISSTGEIQISVTYQV
jgi:hypothetical protein